jgi:hypothetical protein
MAQHITDQMRRFLEARRDFLMNNRPACAGSKQNPWQPGIQIMPGRFVGLTCEGAPPVRLIDQGTPAQWMCSKCRRSWTQEPEPTDEEA